MSYLHDRLEQVELAMRQLGAVSPPKNAALLVYNRALQFGGCTSQMSPARLAIENGLYLAAQAIAIGNREWLSMCNITPGSLHPTGTSLAIGIRFFEFGLLSNIERLEAVSGGFVPHGTCEAWHKNGVQCSLENWQHGQRHGETRLWDDSGVLRERVSYKNGLVVGNRVTYFENGRVALVENRDDKSVAHGVQLFFRPDGLLSSANIFEHGVLVKQFGYEPGREVAGMAFGNPHNGIAFYWHPGARWVKRG